MNTTFWVPRNLYNHKDRQARISDTVLVKSIEMTSRSQTLPWWLGEGRGKDDRKQNTLAPLSLIISLPVLCPKRVYMKLVTLNIKYKDDMS